MIGPSTGCCIVPVATISVVDKAAGCVAFARIVPATVNRLATIAANTLATVIWCVDTAGALHA